MAGLSSVTSLSSAGTVAEPADAFDVKTVPARVAELVASGSSVSVMVSVSTFSVPILVNCADPEASTDAISVPTRTGRTSLPGEPYRPPGRLEYLELPAGEGVSNLFLPAAFSQASYWVENGS